MSVQLMPHQKEAVTNLKNGSILWGGVGSGKTMTALAYYIASEAPKDVVVITTAKKRDSLDWEEEALMFGIGTEPGLTHQGVLTVDSWNNIGKYIERAGCFFIFDEQRLVGTGTWVKHFIKISQKNRWILLSATPGDTWLDYAPVFIANGFYKNITDFKRKHVLYEPWSKFPKVKGYLNETKLELLRNEILVEMAFVRHTERMVNRFYLDYDQVKFNQVVKDRWNPYEDKPVKDVSELFRLMRRISNEDPSRIEFIRRLLTCHDRLIIFYNFNYELELLRELKDRTDVFEWNGHRKDPVPEGDKWVYLVQYVAGAEGWNCVSTDAMVLYSMTYSYKNFMQALGRIDRLNTPYTTLYYYLLTSYSAIDLAVLKSLTLKKSFNERIWAQNEGL